MSKIKIFNKARNIKKSLGVRVAAGYLRNQGVTLETALYLLTTKGK